MFFMDGRAASCCLQVICYKDKWVIFIARLPWTLCHQADLSR